MAETTKPQEFYDDSSAALGLTHSVRERAQREGTPLDGKGRPIVVLPNPETGYNPELVGKSPEQIAEILAKREGHDACEDPSCARCNHVDDRLVSEAPGSTAERHGSGGSGRRRRKPAPVPDRTKQNVIDIEKRDLRPCSAGGKVSREAHAALYAAGNPSVGEILEYVGKALARGVTWTQITNSIQLLTLAQ